jgi:hypothetical protein
MARDNKSDWRKLRDKRKKERERKADGPPTALNPAPAPKKKPGVSSRGAKNTNYSPQRVKKDTPKPGKKPGYGLDNMPSSTNVVKSLIGSGESKAKDTGTKTQKTVEYTVKKMPATPAKSKNKSSGNKSSSSSSTKAAPKKASSSSKKATSSNNGRKNKAWWKGPSKSEAKRVENRFKSGKK